MLLSIDQRVEIGALLSFRARMGRQAEHCHRDYELLKYTRNQHRTHPFRDSSSFAPLMVNNSFLRPSGKPEIGFPNKLNQALTPAPIGHDTPVPPRPQ